ncbi:MAG: methylated-DNA--[Oscillospiraceae bacterium]|nr:methylated-DNA--[protein]-cysteine S-methyltransferase [Oscillospiraceae bacterium]
MVFIRETDSPLGRLHLASDGENLTGLWMDGQKYYAATIKGEELADGSNIPVLDEAEAWLKEYFEGRQPSPGRLRLAPKGSPFRQKVWKILLSIPYGQTMTYGSIARKLCEEDGLDSMSAQAVGGAVGHNPISIIIPCHRVLGSDGSLTGYAGGIEKKSFLLSLEGIDISGR